MKLSDIATLAIERINLIDKKHIFNQVDIIRQWELLSHIDLGIIVAEIIVDVSSGFYIRQLVEDIGLSLGVKTMTIEIERVAYL